MDVDGRGQACPPQALCPQPSISGAEQVFLELHSFSVASPSSGGFDLWNALKVRRGTCLNLFSSEKKTVETVERKRQVSLGRTAEGGRLSSQRATQSSFLSHVLFV